MSLSRSTHGKGGLVPIEGNRKKLNEPDPDCECCVLPLAMQAPLASVLTPPDVPCYQTGT